MDVIFIWSPILFGAVIGWLIVYFTRKLLDFSTDNLYKVSGVSIGGTSFCSLSFIESAEIGSKVIMCYLLGIAIGFFLHWIYQVCITICLRKRFYNHRILYDALSGCNVPSIDNIDGSKLHRKAEKIIVCYQQWDKGKISQQEMIRYFQESEISKKEFNEMIDENKDELLLDDVTQIFIKAKGLDQYFK